MISTTHDNQKTSTNIDSLDLGGMQCRACQQFVLLTPKGLCPKCGHDNADQF